MCSYPSFIQLDSFHCFLFIAYKVSKRVSKSILVVDLEKYDFFQNLAWPSLAGGGWVEKDSLCTSTQQYGHDKKESKSISLTGFKLQGGTDTPTDRQRQTNNADHIGFFANPKNTIITPR